MSNRVVGRDGRLRVLSDGEREPQFLRVQEKEALIWDEVARLRLDELRRHPLLSANAKTTVSLDFPVGLTCRPTALCARLCYASSPRAATTWRKSLRKRLRNLRYVSEAPVDEVVEKLSIEVDRARLRFAKRTMLDFLRVNGGGDLFPELVPVVNAFAEQRPDVRLWIVTRRFELARAIRPLSNVFLQLSLDATTPAADEAKARALVATHARAYLSYLRHEGGDDTKGAAIVFNEKRRRDLPFNGVTDCPADAGLLPLDNVRGVGGTACSKCRRCFSDRTLALQARLVADRAADCGETG